MTQQEYEQKRHDSWIRFKTETMFMVDEDAFKAAFDRAFVLGKQERDAEKSKEKLMCLRDRTKVCNRCHACDIDADAWHSMYSR